MTDSEFKALMLRSAENAHRKLFDEYSGYVYSICANKLNDCGSKEDIEECLSDSFAAIFRYFDSESNRNGDLKGIIGTITKRIAVDYFRKLSGKTGRTVSIDDEEFPTFSSDIRVDDETEKAVIREIIMDCIDRLGEYNGELYVNRRYSETPEFTSDVIINETGENSFTATRKYKSPINSMEEYYNFEFALENGEWKINHMLNN